VGGRGRDKGHMHFCLTCVSKPAVMLKEGTALLLFSARNRFWLSWAGNSALCRCETLL
jgi:hypothetical protein